MDPITRAMEQLAEDAEAYWQAYPGRMLPLIAREDERSMLVQALRRWENAPENRRPFMVCEMAFTSADAYFAKVGEQIARDYEALRKGVAEEGVALEAFVDEGLDGADAAHRAAHLLGDHFDGLLVALIPEQVNDAEGWGDAIKILASGSWPVRVRWAVLSPPSGPLADILGEEGARLQLEPGAVLAFLKQTAPPGTFQALMLEAAEAQAAGRPEEAAGIYREARVLCRAEGQREAESIVLVAYAGACLAAGAAGLAAHSYHEAAQIAEEAGAWSLACQAWLGMGGALVARGKHRSAGVAYRTAAALAKRAGAEPLEAEALRLAAELSAPKEVQP